MEVLLPPQGHYFSPQEEVNRDIQALVREWQPRGRQVADGNITKFGPQNYEEAIIALNDAIADMKKELPSGGTKLQKCIRSAYYKRGSSQYFKKCHDDKLKGESKKAWEKVKEMRRVTPRGTPFIIEWDPCDGSGTCAVTCKNLETPPFEYISYAQAQAAASRAPVVARPESEVTQFINAPASYRVGGGVREV